MKSEEVLHAAAEHDKIFAVAHVVRVEHIFARTDADQMPDIARFLRVIFKNADGAAPHLVAQHVRAYEACKDEGVDAWRIPAFSEQGFGADESLKISLRKKPADKSRHKMPVAGNIYLYIICQKPGGRKADALRFVGDGEEGIFCLCRDDDDRTAQHGKTDAAVRTGGMTPKLFKERQYAELERDLSRIIFTFGKISIRLEGALALPDQLFERWQTRNLQQPCGKKYQALRH